MIESKLNDRIRTLYLNHYFTYLVFLSPNCTSTFPNARRQIFSSEKIIHCGARMDGWPEIVKISRTFHALQQFLANHQMHAMLRHKLFEISNFIIQWTSFIVDHILEILRIRLKFWWNFVRYGVRTSWPIVRWIAWLAFPSCWDFFRFRLFSSWV